MLEVIVSLTSIEDRSSINRYYHGSKAPRPHTRYHSHMQHPAIRNILNSDISGSCGAKSFFGFAPKQRGPLAQSGRRGRPKEEVPKVQLSVLSRSELSDRARTPIHFST